MTKPKGCPNCRWQCQHKSWEECMNKGYQYFEPKLPRPNQPEEEKEDE